MIEIKTQTDVNQSSGSSHLVRCPSCKQVMADVKKLKGHGTVRLKCRRCGTYAIVDIIGT